MKLPREVLKQAEIDYQVQVARVLFHKLVKEKKRTKSFLFAAAKRRGISLENAEEALSQIYDSVRPTAIWNARKKDYEDGYRYVRP